MKKFLIKIICFIGFPLVALLGIYIIDDPFKVVKPFSLDYVSKINRGYVSTELFIRNYSKYKYDSFIFGSSRVSALNSYQWKEYLSEGSIPFVYQAWSEKLTGVYQKMCFLDDNNIEIRNVIIVLDIPGSFSFPQEMNDAESIPHYRIAEKRIGKCKLYYQYIFFKTYLTPTKIAVSCKDIFVKNKSFALTADSISNDYNVLNRDNYKIRPIQDKTLDKSEFYEKGIVETYSDIMINANLLLKLQKIKEILVKNKTKYAIIISPNYSEMHINMEDLKILTDIFGEEHVYNYTGKNEINSDKYNFYDISHFDANIGWDIIEDIKFNF